MAERDARVALQTMLLKAIHAADEGAADWRIAEAILDLAKVTGTVTSLHHGLTHVTVEFALTEEQPHDR